MAEVKLLINTQQAQQALKDINARVTELKVNGATVHIGGKQITSELDQATQSAKELGEKTKEAGEDADKATKSFLSSLGKLPGKLKQGKQAAELFYKALVSPWTKILIAVQVAVKIFTYFFNNLTQSIPKVVAKAQNLVKVTQTQAKEFEKQKKAADQYRKSLQSLIQKESLTSSQQLLAQAIIAKLSERYKGLKIAIDQTTGAIVGYTEAQKLMDRQDQEQQLKIAKRQELAQKNAVNAQLAKVFGTHDVAIGKKISGNELFTNAEKMFGDLSKKDRQNIARRWSQAKTGEEYRKIIEDLATTYENNEDVLTNINGVLDAMDKWVESQQKVNSLTDAGSLIIANGQKNAEKTKAINEDILQTEKQTDTVLKSIIDAQQKGQYDALESNEQKAEWLQKKIDGLKQDASDLEQSVGNAGIQVANTSLNEDQINKATDAIKVKMDQATSSVNDLNEEMDRLTRKYERIMGEPVQDNWLTPQNIKKIENQINRLNSMIDMQKDSPYKNEGLVTQKAQQERALSIVKRVLQINKEISKIGEQQKSLRGQLNDNLAKGNEAEQETLKTKAKLAELEKQRADKEKQILGYQEQLKNVNKDIQTQKQKQAQSISEVYANYESQLDAYNKSARQIAIETALANAEKAKGAELTQEQIDQVKFYVTQLENMKQLEEERKKNKQQQDAIEGIFSGYQESQAVEYLKLIGAEKEALILQAKINAEKAKGAALTDEEYQSLRKYIETQMLMQSIDSTGNIAINSNGIISNELAKKGGFASSVVVDRAQDINAQILSQAKVQTSLAEQLRNEMQQNNTILKNNLII